MRLILSFSRALALCLFAAVANAQATLTTPSQRVADWAGRLLQSAAEFQVMSSVLTDRDATEATRLSTAAIGTSHHCIAVSELLAVYAMVRDPRNRAEVAAFVRTRIAGHIEGMQAEGMVVTLRVYAPGSDGIKRAAANLKRLIDSTLVAIASESPTR